MTQTIAKLRSRQYTFHYKFVFKLLFHRILFQRCATCCLKQGTVSVKNTARKSSLDEDSYTRMGQNEIIKLSQ